MIISETLWFHQEGASKEKEAIRRRRLGERARTLYPDGVLVEEKTTQDAASVTRRITQEYGEEWLFSFYSVFVTENGKIRQDAAKAAVETSGESFNAPFVDSGKLHSLYQKAQEHLENTLNLWDWDEEVDLLNMAVVEFQS